MKANPPHKRKLLLYIDILGFKEMCLSQDFGAVEQTLNNCLQAFLLAQNSTSKFETIRFSDTVLFYQTTVGFKPERFDELAKHTVGIFNRLLAQGIPVSGAIAFGEFRAPKKKKAEDHPLYFGKPLVEAYQLAEGEKWLGIIVCPSVTRGLKSTVIAQGKAENRWAVRSVTRAGKKEITLSLNTFLPLLEHFDSPRSVEQHGNILPEAVNLAASALRFVRNEARKFGVDGEFSTSRSAKYHATLGFVQWWFAVATEGKTGVPSYQDVIEWLHRRSRRRHRHRVTRLKG
jgi:hypothetical protein